MKFLLTVSPTKFFSLTCPLYIRTHCPDSTFHSFSSLSVELQGETRVVSLISRRSPSFLYCQYCSTYTEDIFYQYLGTAVCGTYAETISFWLMNWTYVNILEHPLAVKIPYQVHGYGTCELIYIHAVYIYFLYI